MQPPLAQKKLLDLSRDELAVVLEVAAVFWPDASRPVWPSRGGALVLSDERQRSILRAANGGSSSECLSERRVPWFARFQICFS